jgi:hypothetical protein
MSSQIDDRAHGQDLSIPRNAVNKTVQLPLLRPAATLRELPFDYWCRTEKPCDALDAAI